MSEPLRPDLETLLAFWQPTLGLRDWVIRVEYDRTLDVLGRTTVWWRDKEARVRICEPANINREWPPVDVELTFVHELVHCVVEPLTHAAKDMHDDLREQQVEQLAKSFIRLHRVYPLANDWLAPTRADTMARGSLVHIEIIPPVPPVPSAGPVVIPG